MVRLVGLVMTDDPTLDHCDHRLPLLAVGQYPTRRTRWLLSLIVLVADAVVSFTA